MVWCILLASGISTLISSPEDILTRTKSLNEHPGSYGSYSAVIKQHAQTMPEESGNVCASGEDLGSHHHAHKPLSRGLDPACTRHASVVARL